MSDDLARRQKGLELFAAARKSIAEGTFDRAAWLQLVRDVRELVPELGGAAVQMGATYKIVANLDELAAALAEIPRSSAPTDGERPRPS